MLLLSCKRQNGLKMTDVLTSRTIESTHAPFIQQPLARDVGVEQTGAGASAAAPLRRHQGRLAIETDILVTDGIALLLVLVSPI